MMDRDERARLDEIVGRYGGNAAHLLAILQDIQDERNYLPRAWLEELAARLAVPMTKIYRTASFFKALSLKPRGKRIVTVCVGTTCHVRGAPKLVDKIVRDFAIKPGETTADMGLTLETVGCVGACALGPLAVIDGKYLGHMTGEKLGKALGKSTGEQS